MFYKKSVLSLNGSVPAKEKRGVSKPGFLVSALNFNQQLLLAGEQSFLRYLISYYSKFQDDNGFFYRHFPSQVLRKSVRISRLKPVRKAQKDQKYHVALVVTGRNT